MFDSQTRQLVRRSANFAPAILFILAAGVRLVPGERLVDDAYITFRYARNIVDGLGFVYNSGQPVLGTTTPLYTLLLAGLAWIFQSDNYPALSIGINALADGATCALLIPLGVALSGRRRVGIAAGLLYALAPFSVTFAIGGLETSVVVLLLTATAILYLRGRDQWAVTAALALLTRPDALILVGPIAIDWLIGGLARSWADRRAGRQISFAPWLRPVVFGLAPLLPWAVFAGYYFGSPIPHSITAKTAAYYLKPEEGLIRLVQHYATPFFEENIFVGAGALLTTLVLYCALALAGGLAAIRRDRHAWPIAAYPFLYFAVFALANPLIFRWYLTPPLPFYFLLILTGVSQIAAGLAQRWGREWPSALVFGAAGLLFVALSLRAWVLTPDHGPDRPAPGMAWFKLEQIYARVGEELAPELRPGQVIAAGDIGALGYFSRATILDTLGLVSPQSTAFYPLPHDQLVINYAISADLIADQRPDYVVFLEVYGRNTLLVDPRFASRYTLREKIPTDIYGSQGMLIYQLK